MLRVVVEQSLVCDKRTFGRALARKNPSERCAFASTSTRSGDSVSSSMNSSSSGADSIRARQKAAYDYYRRKREVWPFSVWKKWFPASRAKVAPQRRLTTHERNVALAWYASALIVGALGATYAAVPLYKVFCQTTGFGGTTQRVRIISTNNEENDNQHWLNKMFDSLQDYLLGYSSSGSSFRIGMGGARVHTWTNEEAATKLAQLRPVENAELITVRFDSTVSNNLPWSFEPVQLDVKVVPGETALSFFRVTNHSDKAITGVATYNVHPPKFGLYFQKIQCFCFEEQRLLPGETVEMPVFFFLDPDLLNDPQVNYVRSITLGYTFFLTDEDWDFDDDDDDDDEEEVQQEKR